jgi:hypothetical protein
VGLLLLPARIMDRAVVMKTQLPEGLWQTAMKADVRLQILASAGCMPTVPKP